MTEELFPDNQRLTFEDFKHENGMTYWWASDLMKMLAYKDMRSFQKVLDRATKAFVSLNIPHYENIIACTHNIAGTEIQDFKLTRFACYIVVMNGDPKKVEVAEAQAYFAQQTRKFELAAQGADDLERLLIRDEIAEGNKSLASAAAKSGVDDFAKFANAGYLGMYNMMSYQLEIKRGVKRGKLFDGMSRTELAANLFRVTQTEERIKSRNIRGQQQLENTHKDVGQEVRKIVIQNTGKAPENLQQVKPLQDVKKGLKDGHRKMLNADQNKNSKK